MPAVVSAAVPMRTPLATAGGRGSNGIEFLLQTIPARVEARLPGVATGQRPLEGAQVDEDEV